VAAARQDEGAPPAGAARDRLDTLAARVGLSGRNRELFLDRALTFDDDVAEALFSQDRRGAHVRAHGDHAAQAELSRPGAAAGVARGWTLTLDGLASGRTERLDASALARFPKREQVTRLVCVEGWSAVAWWGGYRVRRPAAGVSTRARRALGGACAQISRDPAAGPSLTSSPSTAHGATRADACSRRELSVPAAAARTRCAASTCRDPSNSD
jgi:hypothetical protein